MSVLCPPQTNTYINPHLRTLESIKDELFAGHQTNEADMHGICELAEMLRDAVVEYQVRFNLKAHIQLELLPEYWTVCTTEGNV